MSKAIPPKAPSSTGALERITLRNGFYRDGFRSLVTGTPILALCLLVSIGLNVVQFNRPAQNHYFAIDPENRLVPIRSLSEPYITEAWLLNWVSTTVTRSYRIDPQNYKAQVMEMAPDYTPEGLQQYIDSLKSSGTIKFITDNLLVSSAIPTGTPLVVERNVTPSGVYYWRIQMPILVEYRSATKSAQKRRVVEVVVVRRQTMDSPKGVGISQFVATDT
jgi:intracellular multiplication protein IcmL